MEIMDIIILGGATDTKGDRPSADGGKDHTQLLNRNASNQHTIESITDLKETIENINNRFISYSDSIDVLAKVLNEKASTIDVNNALENKADLKNNNIFDGENTFNNNITVNNINDRWGNKVFNVNSNGTDLTLGGPYKKLILEASSDDLTLKTQGQEIKLLKSNNIDDIFNAILPDRESRENKSINGFTCDTNGWVMVQGQNIKVLVNNNIICQGCSIYELPVKKGDILSFENVDKCIFYELNKL